MMRWGEGWERQWRKKFESLMHVTLFLCLFLIYTHVVDLNPSSFVLHLSEYHAHIIIIFSKLVETMMNDRTFCYLCGVVVNPAHYEISLVKNVSPHNCIFRSMLMSVCKSFYFHNFTHFYVKHDIQQEKIKNFIHLE